MFAHAHFSHALFAAPTVADMSMLIILNSYFVAQNNTYMHHKPVTSFVLALKTTAVNCCKTWTLQTVAKIRSSNQQLSSIMCTTYRYYWGNNIQASLWTWTLNPKYGQWEPKPSLITGIIWSLYKHLLCAMIANKSRPAQRHWPWE